MSTFSRWATALHTSAALGYRQLTGSKRTPERLYRLMCAVDPSPRKKNVRWICERLADRTFLKERELWNLGQGFNSQVTRALMAFEVCKPRLPVEQRNILNYPSIKDIWNTLDPYLRAPKRLSKRYRQMCAGVDASFQALVLNHEDKIGVYEARSIDEAYILTQADCLFEGEHKHLYQNLRDAGRVLIFWGQFSTLIAAQPVEPGERGHVFDENGDRAMFEDLLQQEGVDADDSWEALAPLMGEIIKIDPTVPFDMELEHAEAYRVALRQFPLVLHEDREIPDHLYDEITADGDIEVIVREALSDA